MADFGPRAFFAQTIPGIERIAWREIHSVLRDTTLLGFRRLRDKNGIVLFQYRGDPKELLQLKSTEDIFYLLAHQSQVTNERAGLRTEEAVRFSRYFDVGLEIRRELGDVRRARRTTFRVIARKQGSRHRYRRIDLQRAVEKGILRRYKSRWRQVEERADLEIWSALLEEEALHGLRLSDRTMRHRTYKVSHLPASLRPTVAAAMVLLSEPQPDDVFLDPMCGSGTILIERALSGRYGVLLGGDIDTRALEASRRNIGPRYRPIQIHHWDATSLALPDGSASKLVSNLPFGRQLGSHEANAVLYPRLMREAQRVLRPGGRAVLLTGQDRLTSISGQHCQKLRSTDRWPITLLGMPATIHVLERA